MRIKVTLRKKPISKGRLSLYLDFYPAIISPTTGKKTRRKFLKRYIWEHPRNKVEKNFNIETLEYAEKVKKKYENELSKPEIYSVFEQEQLRINELGEQSFLEYFEKQAKKRKGITRQGWFTSLHYLREFSENSLKFNELTELYFENFKHYLLNTKKMYSTDKLSQNTASMYFKRIKSGLKQAYRDGILQNDLSAKISGIKTKETRREYLTIEELNKLVKTECKIDVLKRACLFSALTGLRFSDVRKMQWSELEFLNEKGYFLKFQQKKTKSFEYLPLTEQAYSFTNGTPNPNDMPQNELVFIGLNYGSFNDKYIKKWTIKAGIDKHITFHNFRHSFATNQLFSGTDIYTVSKMLGHKSLNTTQIYAKIVDDTKRKAVNRIKLDLE